MNELKETPDQLCFLTPNCTNREQCDIAKELYIALEELRNYAIKEIQRGGAHHDIPWAKAATALAKARGEMIKTTYDDKDHLE